MNILHSKSPEIQKFLVAIGADKASTDVTIFIRPNELVRVVIDKVLVDEAAKEFNNIINTYTLTEVKNEKC